MLSRYSVIVDAHDPVALAGFGAAVLGHSVAFARPDEVAIGAPDEAGPAVVFVSPVGSKSSKNRLHVDLNPQRWRRSGVIGGVYGHGTTANDSDNAKSAVVKQGRLPE